MSLNHLDDKILNMVVERLWDAQGSIRGLAALFMQGSNEVSLEGSDCYGIGQLLGKISEELGILEDILRCGEDSTANKRNGVVD